MTDTLRIAAKPRAGRPAVPRAALTTLALLLSLTANPPEAQANTFSLTPNQPEANQSEANQPDAPARATSRTSNQPEAQARASSHTPNQPEAQARASSLPSNQPDAPASASSRTSNQPEAQARATPDPAPRAATAGDIHPPGLPCGYTVEVIERPGCPEPLGTSPIKVTGMNEAGIVVGHRRDCFEPTRRQAWIWHPGDTTPTDLPTPDEIVSSLAYDISAKNVIVGEFKRYLEPWRGFVYDTNTAEWTELEPVDPTGSGRASANAINNAGVVAGTRSIGESHQPYNAFIWSADDGYTDLGVMEGPYSRGATINESGTVAGWTGSSLTSAEGFRWSNGKYEVLPLPEGAVSAIVHDNSNSGAMCGAANLESAQAVYWNEDGEPALLAPVDTDMTCAASAVGTNETAYGSCRFFDDPNTRYATLWHDGVPHYLTDFVDDASLHFRHASAVNNAGVVLARGKDGSTSVGLVLTPIATPFGDLTGDCEVGPEDLGILLSEWGNSDSPADFTGNGTVGGADLGILLSNWTQ